ncbi:NADH-quinone oxidoreductase subunit NuoF [candidate division KSB1 bacterium]|nr:NADH-quinone oxidoreductase subunit NuoF [candidate division KSB1 bacterium]MBL7093317.1 NADH-quinone oxidoreductase subunit NuoF [candidate division KSB1 bacterium]
MKQYRTHCLVCTGTGCVSNHAFDIKTALESEIIKQGLKDEVTVIATGCNGFCERGPVMVVQPENIFYQELKEKDIPFLVEEHFLKGRPVEKMMYVPPKEEAVIPKMSDIEFFKHQLLVVLRNRGRIDPEKIDEYIGYDGYRALGKALTEMKPEQIIEEVKTAGLRGRGGAGFPTGIKWGFCEQAEEDTKYLICNADEGDPGAFMDRSILEADPHAVLEGMVIGAKAIGAQEGFIYVRDEYPLALRRINIAIEQATEYGLLGENILGSGFNFKLNVVRGGGAFVCGEETALIASIEGEVGRPKPRPPYPAQKGLWGKPTNNNNVETWANVPQIILRGGGWFASLGTKESKGTKVFSLVGKVNNTGLVEVPMGTTLRTIVFDIGGGVLKGKKFKAVQSGGPSGGCVPESLIDLPVDFEKLTEAGAIMGSGGLIVMDEDTCMVDVAKYFVEFLEEESCGKCNPCREGLKRLKEVLTLITQGKGEAKHLEMLDDIALLMKEASLCALGATAPNPVLTTLKYFREEYEEHIFQRRCRAKVCKDLIMYRIIAEKCTGCQRCVKACPTEAITGPRSQPHNLEESKCIKCGACYEVCKFDAIAGDAIYIE